MSGISRAIGGADLLSRIPILFLPYRIETRFAQGSKGPELWIRVYPDQVEIDTHEAELTQQEIADGKTYWNELWRLGTAPDRPSLQKPWQALAGIYGSQRAAWIVLQMTPTNMAQQPATPTPTGTPPNPLPQYPSPAQQDGSWMQPATVAGLPDHWTVVAYASGSAPKVQDGNQIKTPLSIGLDPNAPPDPDVSVDAAMRWTVDFQTAQDSGMGIVIELSADEAARGFDRILVYGVQNPVAGGQTVFQTLLDHHHYTDGLSWVPQGSRTNNTNDAPSSFRRSDPNAEISFAVERGTALTADASCDAIRAAQWLGIPPSTFDHVQYSDRKEQLSATQMATALWPATLGYFLTNLVNLSDDDVRAARRYFIANVRARGPLPAFRVGTTPYGILPVTSLQLFDPALAAVSVDNRYLNFLRWAWPNFLKGVDSAPRIGGTNDPEGDLVQVLGMDASASAYLVRPILGAEYIWNFISFQGMSESDMQKWLQLQVASAQQVLSAVALGVAQPNIAQVGPSPIPFPVIPDQFSTVQDGNLSETDPLANDATLADGTDTNYIGWLRQATISDLQNWNYPAKSAPTSLLYRLLRQSLLMEYYNQAARSQVQAGQLQAAQTVEPELLNMGATPAVGKWDVLARTVSGVAGAPTWSTYIYEAGVNADPRYVELNDLLAALDYLRGLPTAELDRLLTETLDVCSHRVDAWITSLASLLMTRTLTGAEASRRYIGGYSWVENLRPNPLPAVVSGQLQSSALKLDNAIKTQIGNKLKTTPIYEADANSGGYILAPSANQATTAAVLRSGYLTHRDASNGKLLAIDLSSRRVRNALWTIDGVRQGQPLAALLGYRFEQGLQDLGLQQYQQPFRDEYQFVDNQITPGSPGETVAASNVVNGLALQQDWQNGNLPVGSNWGTDLPPADASPGSDQSKVATLLADLTDIMTAIGDVSVAEGVYQLVCGNPGRSGGILDAVSKGTYPPDPQVLTTPRTGFDLTHRVVVLLTEDQPAVGAWADVTTSPRTQLEPRLNTWVSTLLPDPESVKCYVAYQASSEYSGGTSGTSWTNPSNAEGVPDQTYAAYNAATQDQLQCTLFGLALTPQTSVIGVLVTITGHAASPISAERNIDVALTIDGRTIAGNAKTTTLNLGTDTAIQLGGAGDLWGNPAISAAQANASQFGVLINKSTNKTNEIDIDSVAIAVVVKVPVLLSDLNVGPLDFLAMAHSSDKPQAGEVEQRIIYAAALPSGATNPQVNFVLDPVADVGLISFPDAVTGARAVRDLLDGSRPLYPRDLVDVIQGASLSDKDIDGHDLDNKVATATTVLSDAITALQNATMAGGFQSALLGASYLTVPGAIPMSQYEDLPTLQSRAAAVLTLLLQRQKQATAAVANATTAQAKLEIIRQIFGSSFSYLPRFVPPDSTNLIGALNSSSALQGGNANAARSWFQQLTHIRPGIARLDLALMLAQALANASRPDFTIGQLPYVAGASWVGLPLSASPPKPGVVSIASLITGDYASSTSYCGVMIDEWPERIPYMEQAAGLTFQYQEPISRAPQAVLIALCPDTVKRQWWDTEAIVAILNETLDVAKVRTVDLASVSAAGQVLPMLDFPDNATLGTFSLFGTGTVVAE